MPLTDKEKRVIQSPLSLSSRQKRNTKYRMRNKIQEIIQDMQFVLENHEAVSEEFGIDVMNHDEISKYFTNTNTTNENSETSKLENKSIADNDDDQDLL